MPTLGPPVPAAAAELGYALSTPPRLVSTSSFIPTDCFNKEGNRKRGKLALGLVGRTIPMTERDDDDQTGNSRKSSSDWSDEDADEYLAKALAADLYLQGA